MSCTAQAGPLDGDIYYSNSRRVHVAYKYFLPRYYGMHSYFTTIVMQHIDAFVVIK